MEAVERMEVMELWNPIPALGGGVYFYTAPAPTKK